MDLDAWDVLWGGRGRAKADFAVFFQETDMDYLSEVEAVAMYMIASYNTLVGEHMPWAEIVYDRYHMQAQFGKDVLGAVRLDEARRHNEMAKQLKEEMSRLFNLRDEEEARNGWTEWFKGAKESGIPALVRFAERKEKRLDGPIAHASHPISTGRLEGFNNRIKVAKRIAYGYRDEDYFFSLIQFISIPSVRSQSLKKT